MDDNSLELPDEVRDWLQRPGGCKAQLGDTPGYFHNLPPWGPVFTWSDGTLPWHQATQRFGPPKID